MTKSFSVRKQFRVGRGRNNERRSPNALLTAPVNRVPRISRLMALAIRFDQLIRDGIVADQTELAVAGHVSRARLTQIMNLLNLAPDIQEALLGPSLSQSGLQQISERTVRAMSGNSSWRKQRNLWNSKILET